MIQQVTDKHRLIAVLGASGSGKSSLLRAGLLYQLKLGQHISGSDRWTYITPFTPKESPVESLQEAFAVLLPNVSLTPLNPPLQSRAVSSPKTGKIASVEGIKAHGCKFD